MSIILNSDSRIVIQGVAGIEGRFHLKQMMDFTLPVLSPDTAVRNQFWMDLQKAENRNKEKWVSYALSYLHHPLRSEQSGKYLPKTLDLPEDTGKRGFNR